MKICGRCDLFFIGESKRCASCNNKRKEYVKNNKEKVAKQAKKWRKEHPGSGKVTNLKSHLKVNFGLTIEAFNALKLKQKSLCAICAGVPSEYTRLQVDHDHKTSKVRGLLCGKCNRALGLFGDSAILLQNAVNYLKETK